MQTVVVIIVARNVVEGVRETRRPGIPHDRLELPLLDQLSATAINEDGAWIYRVLGSRNAALVAGGTVACCKIWIRYPRWGTAQVRSNN